MKREQAERDAKLRLLHRLVMSYQDFQQASQIASYILVHKLQEKVDRLRGRRRYRVKLLWQALNCAMVVAYCRPFQGNDRRSAKRVPDLPKRFLKTFSSKEKEIHTAAMEDRNTLLAHSDSGAWNLRLFFLEMPAGRRMLMPLSHDVRAPLIHEAVQRLCDMCGKLMKLVFDERMRLEKELGDFLPTVKASEIVVAEEEEKKQAEGSESEKRR
jgi:hypothetical protein